jgi:hypothetical protein
MLSPGQKPLLKTVNPPSSGYFFMCCCADWAIECQEIVLRAGIKKGAYAPSSIAPKSGSE